MTNEDLAKKLGIHYSLVSRLRNGKRLPSINVITRISKRFKLPIAEIVKAVNQGPAEFSRYLNEHIPPGPDTPPRK